MHKILQEYEIQRNKIYEFHKNSSYKFNSLQRLLEDLNLNDITSISCENYLNDILFSNSEHRHPTDIIDDFVIGILKQKSSQSHYMNSITCLEYILTEIGSKFFIKSGNQELVKKLFVKTQTGIHIGHKVTYISKNPITKKYTINYDVLQRQNVRAKSNFKTNYDVL